MSNQLKERLTKKIGDFKGVDFTSSPILVNPSRAVLAENFIYKNGINRKRKGYREFLKITYNKNGELIKPNINGIFEFTIYNKKFFIVYAGTRFFKVEKVENSYVYTDITFSSSTTSNMVDKTKLLDKRISMFICGQKVYFIGAGDYLVFTKYGENFELHRVENDILTYVPTTTINIGYDGEENDIKSSLDSVNLLSSMRKNTLVGADIENDNYSISYTLDSGFIDKDSKVTINIEMIEEDEYVIKRMTNANENELTKLYYDTDSEFLSPMGVIDFENGILEFFDDLGYIEGYANIEVTFSATVEGYADKINKCDIGVLFGVNGNSDRLFLSGNEDFVNYDFYSSSQDFSYFEDCNYSIIGSSNSRIMAYTRLADSTLAIQKEYVSGEPSIYYRTGKMQSTYSNGILQEVISYFPIEAGTIGQGVKSKYCNANLAGDKLFLGDNGVYGIEMSSNNSTNERFAKSRSEFIKEKIKKCNNLEDAVAIVYDNNYFLAVDNMCFIANAIFTTSSKNILNDTFNYDWWYWTNMPVNVWGILNKKLIFGTKDGRICEFYDGYKDCIFENTSNGELLIDFEENKIVCSSLLQLKENDTLKFNNNVYSLLLSNEDIIRIENNKIYVSPEIIIKLFDGIEVFANESNNTTLNLKYTITNVDWGDSCFNLSFNNNIIEINDSNIELYINLNGKELIISNIEDNEFNLKLHKNSDILKLSLYNEEILENLTAKIIINNPVVAYWYTPMFDFNYNNITKTLLKLTISTEPTTNGKLEFGYRTKNNIDSFNSQGMNLINLNNLDFNNFSFNTNFANSYTLELKDDFNFIQFYFVSNNDCDCVVQNITATYKLNKSNKGVE